MQIAQIVPKVLTQKEAIFDYAIPPQLLPHIKPRILVEIPFHDRKVEGIIVGLKRKTKMTSPLKSIIRILDPVPVLDENHLKLSFWMADYYFVPLGKTLFENVVPPAISLIKTSPHWPNELVKTQKSQAPQKYLVMADFSKRLEFYLAATKNTLKQNKSIIILVPDLSLVKYFLKIFERNPQEISLIHSGLKKTARWQEFNKIRQGKIKIVIGSTSALFAPIQNLGLIIIDQEENESYKNERSPRFHATTVAENLGKLYDANLILGSLTPRVTSYFQALKNIYLLKKSISLVKPKITIVSQEGRFQPLSHPLREKMEENLKKQQKIILVLNRKGEGTKFACPDCGWNFTCPKCHLPLIPFGEKINCFRCQVTLIAPEKCPKCQSVNLRSFGLGTTKLAKFVKDFWPEAQIIRLEESFKSRPSQENDWDIAIATSYALKFNFPPIGLVAIIDADSLLNLPDFRVAEKSFQTFYKFLKIGEQGIIQTNLPDNPMISALAKLDYEKFFLSELLERKKYQFPPFTRLIRLLYKNREEEKCLRETQRVKQILSRLDILILGPAPAFYKKRRQYFRWQIILKIRKNQKNELVKLKNILATLPKGWTVDVDPMEML